MHLACQQLRCMFPPAAFHRCTGYLTVPPALFTASYSLEHKHKESFGMVPTILIVRSHLGPTPDRADVSRDESPLVH